MTVSEWKNYGEKYHFFDFFKDKIISEERERFIEKLNYLKQCANGRKFPYWESSERPVLIIQEIEDLIQELQNK